MNLLVFNLNTDLDHQTQAFTTTWINALAKVCTKVVVITMRAGRICVADNVKVFSVGKECGYSEIRRGLHFYLLLSKVLRTERIDACFAHMMPLFSVMGYPLLRRKSIPILLWYAHKATPWMLKAAHQIADHIVTSSQHAFGLKSGKVTVIGQGIDTDWFTVPRHNARHSDRFNVVSVGRLSPIKTLEVLIDAAHILVNDYRMNELFVRIIGASRSTRDRVYGTCLDRQVKALGLEHVVCFEGLVPFENIRDFLWNADLAYNGCPAGAPDKAVLEAMSCGVPVVVLNPTFRTMLDDQPGWLWAGKGTPLQVAECIYRASRLNDINRLKMQRALREYVVQNHSLEQLSNRILQILSDLKVTSQANSKSKIDRFQ